MTLQEFHLQAKRLADEYGGQNYGKERIGAMWRRFKDVPISDFKSVIDRCFESDRFAPLTKELARILEEVRTEKHHKLKMSFREISSGSPIEGEQAGNLARNVRSIISGIAIAMPKESDE